MKIRRIKLRMEFEKDRGFEEIGIYRSLPAVIKSLRGFWKEGIEPFRVQLIEGREIYDMPGYKGFYLDRNAIKESTSI